MILSFNAYNEKKKNDPCWKGYKQIGTKEKDGKTVPNCVPEEKDEKDEDEDEEKNEHLCSFEQFIIEKKDPRLDRAGVEGYNKPKRTPNHPTKSHIVVAKEGDDIKTLRFGEQGAETAGKPKKGESQRMKSKRKRFKARHAKNIARGKMSPAWWSAKVKW